MVHFLLRTVIICPALQPCASDVGGGDRPQRCHLCLLLGIGCGDHLLHLLLLLRRLR